MPTLAQVIEEEASANGNLPDGFLYASFKNTGSSPASVNSVRLQPGEAKDFPFVGKGYEAIPFDPQASSLAIMFVI